MSTGDELVDLPSSTSDPDQKQFLQGSQIYDSNRITLLSALRQDTSGATVRCVDLGIVRDQREGLRARMLAAAQSCDVVITSGGVSMGAADLVKVSVSSK